MEARSRWPSIINEKTIADFKRVAEQTGSSATGVLILRASSIFRNAKQPELTPERFTAIHTA
jgi:hypothetical protein